MGRWTRAGALALGCAGLVVLSAAVPAAAQADGPDAPCSTGCSPPGGNAGADCADASMNTPPSWPADVELTADVVDGAIVVPGQDVMLRLTWDPKKWSGPDLDRALHCVRLKGELAPELSAEEQPTANDGLSEYRLHLPDSLQPGSDICAQAFLAGEAGEGGPQQLRAERRCFISGAPEPARPPAPPVTGPPAAAIGAAPAPITPPPLPGAAQVPPTSAMPTAVPAQTSMPSAPRTEVAGMTAVRPGPTSVPAAVPATPPPGPGPSGGLARTGGASSRPMTAGGGMALCLGGLAVILGGGRRPGRRAGPVRPGSPFRRSPSDRTA